MKGHDPRRTLPDGSAGDSGTTAPGLELRDGPQPRFGSRLKVLYCVGYYASFTGSQRSVALLAQHRPPETECVAVFPGRGQATERFEAAGIRARVVEAPQSLTEFGGALLDAPWHRWLRVFLRDVVPYALRLYRIVREEQPDVVHCSDARALLQMGWAARAARVPVVWHLQGENVLRSHPIVNWIAGRLSSCTIVVAEALTGQAPRGKPVHAIHLGVEPGVVPDDSVHLRLTDELRGRGFRREDTVVALTASALVPFKGLHHLVPALRSSLSGLAGDRTLVWVALGSGEGPGRAKYVAHLRRLAAQHGVEGHILWIGWVPDARPWMAAADLVVLPTVRREDLVYPDGERISARAISEGFPRVVLEAMTQGCPVVASEVGGVPEVLDQRAGVLVPPGDEPALASALSRLAADDELRAAMGRHALASSARFPLGRYVARTFGVYRALVPSLRTTDAAQ